MVNGDGETDFISAVSQGDTYGHVSGFRANRNRTCSRVGATRSKRHFLLIREDLNYSALQ